MSERITPTNLRALVDRINRTTGSPMTHGEMVGSKYRCNPGHFCLDKNIGGWSLERVCNDGGGVTTILPRGTARELWDQGHAFLKGWEMAKEARRHD